MNIFKNSSINLRNIIGPSQKAMVPRVSESEKQFRPLL